MSPHKLSIQETEKELTLAFEATKDQTFLISTTILQKNLLGNLREAKSKVLELFTLLGQLTAEISSLKILREGELGNQLEAGLVGRLSTLALDKQIQSVEDELQSLNQLLILQKIQMGVLDLETMLARSGESSIAEKVSKLQLQLAQKFLSEMQIQTNEDPADDAPTKSLRKTLETAGTTLQQMEAYLTTEAALKTTEIKNFLSEVRGVLAQFAETKRLTKIAKNSELKAWSDDLRLSAFEFSRGLLRLEGDLKIGLASSLGASAKLETYLQANRKKEFWRRERVRALQRWKVELGVFR